MHIAFEWWNGMCMGMNLSESIARIAATFCWLCSIWNFHLDARFIFHFTSIVAQFLFESFEWFLQRLLVTSCVRTNEMNEKQKQPASHGIKFYFCAFVSMVSAMHFVWPDTPKTYASHMFPFEPNAIITQKCYRRFDKDGDTDSEQTVHLCSVISWEAQCYKCGQRIALRRLILSGSVVFRWTQCFNYRFAFSFSSENRTYIFVSFIYKWKYKCISVEDQQQV